MDTFYIIEHIRADNNKCQIKYLFSISTIVLIISTSVIVSVLFLINKGYLVVVTKVTLLGGL